MARLCKGLLLKNIWLSLFQAQRSWFRAHSRGLILEAYREGRLL